MTKIGISQNGIRRCIQYRKEKLAFLPVPDSLPFDLVLKGCWVSIAYPPYQKLLETCFAAHVKVVLTYVDRYWDTESRTK